MLGIVYKATDTTNNKVYIGQTTQTLEVRISEHYSRSRSKAYPNKPYFTRVLAKRNKADILWEVISETDNKEELDKLEKYYILFFNSRDNKVGYNLTDGGEGCYGYKHTPETLIKLSKIRKGSKLSDEEIRNRSEKQSKDWEIIAPSGETYIIRNLSRYCRDTGLNLQEMRKVNRGISDSHRGYKCRRLSEITHSCLETTINRMKVMNLGKKHSLETRQKIVELNSKEYLITFPDNTTVVVKNLKLWCENNNLLYNSAMRVSRGIRSHYRHYTFKKIDN